jgi:hypothetical protein
MHCKQNLIKEAHRLGLPVDPFEGRPFLWYNSQGIGGY